MKDQPHCRVRMPGRLCLFGEHSDWAGGYRKAYPGLERGYCLIAPTDQVITAAAAIAQGWLEVSSVVPGGADQALTIPWTRDSLRELALAKGFFSYVAGTAYELLSEYDVPGLKLDITHMDLPMKKGLSSSAAVCMLTVRSVNRLYNLGLDIAQQMDFAYRGEILTGSRCGRMDQACAYPYPVFLIFDGDVMTAEQLKPKRDLYYLIVDLQAAKDTRKILADLNSCFPEAASKLARRVQYALGANNKKILESVRTYLEQGAAQELGAMMNLAQQIFDDYVAPACPQELTAPKLHAVLAYPEIQDLIYGGKGVGSQGDGTAQLLCRGEAERLEVIRILEANLAVRCLPLTIKSHERV